MDGIEGNLASDPQELISEAPPLAASGFCIEDSDEEEDEGQKRADDEPSISIHPSEIQNPGPGAASEGKSSQKSLDVDDPFEAFLKKGSEVIDNATFDDIFGEPDSPVRPLLDVKDIEGKESTETEEQKSSETPAKPPEDDSFNDIFGPGSKDKAEGWGNLDEGAQQDFLDWLAMESGSPSTKPRNFSSDSNLATELSHSGFSTNKGEKEPSQDEAEQPELDPATPSKSAPDDTDPPQSELPTENSKPQGEQTAEPTMEAFSRDPDMSTLPSTPDPPNPPSAPPSPELEQVLVEPELTATRIRSVWRQNKRIPDHLRRRTWITLLTGSSDIAESERGRSRTNSSVQSTKVHEIQGLWSECRLVASGLTLQSEKPTEEANGEGPSEEYFASAFQKIILEFYGNNTGRGEAHNWLCTEVLPGLVATLTCGLGMHRVDHSGVSACLPPLIDLYIPFLSPKISARARAHSHKLASQHFRVLMSYHAPFLAQHLDSCFPGWEIPCKLFSPAEKDKEQKDAEASSIVEELEAMVMDRVAEKSQSGYIPPDNGGGFLNPLWLHGLFVCCMTAEELLLLWDYIFASNDRFLGYFLTLSILLKYERELMELRGAPLKERLGALCVKVPLEAFNTDNDVDSTPELCIQEWCKDATFYERMTPQSYLFTLKDIYNKGVLLAEQEEIDEAEALQAQALLEKQQEEERAPSTTEGEDGTPAASSVEPKPMNTLEKIKMDWTLGKKDWSLKLPDSSKKKDSFFDRMGDSIRKASKANQSSENLDQPQLARKDSRFKTSEEQLLNEEEFFCLTVSPREVLEFLCRKKRPMDDEEIARIRTSELQYFAVDCRPESKNLQGSFPTAFHLDPSKLDDPEELQRILSVFDSLRGKVHICLMGGGEAHLQEMYHTKPSEESKRAAAEDASNVRMTATMFMKRGFPYVSLLAGGYAALHTLLARQTTSYALNTLVDHQIESCRLCKFETLLNLRQDHYLKQGTAGKKNMFNLGTLKMEKLSWGSQKTEEHKKKHKKASSVDLTSSLFTRRPSTNSEINLESIGNKFKNSFSNLSLASRQHSDTEEDDKPFLGASGRGFRMLSVGFNQKAKEKEGEKAAPGTPPSGTSTPQKTTPVKSPQKKLINFSKLRLDFGKEKDGAEPPASEKNQTPIFVIDYDEDSESETPDRRSSLSSTTVDDSKDKMAAKPPPPKISTEESRQRALAQHRISGLHKGEVLTSEEANQADGTIFCAMKKKLKEVTLTLIGNDDHAEYEDTERFMLITADRLLVLEKTNNEDAENQETLVYNVKSNHHLTELVRMTFPKKDPTLITLQYRRGPRAEGGLNVRKQTYRIEQKDKFIKLLQSKMSSFK